MCSRVKGYSVVSRWMNLQYVIGVMAAFGALAITGGAEANARPGYVVHPGGIRFVVPVETTDRYVLSITATANQRIVFKVDGPSSEHEYSTRGRVGIRRLVAHFGQMGDLDVRLHLMPYMSEPPRGGRCHGRSARFQEGTYSGIIKFTDLDLGPPEVSVSRGPIYVIRKFRRACKKRRDGSSNRTNRSLRGEVGTLNVIGRIGMRKIHLEALVITTRREPIQAQGYLRVAVSEALGSVRITRTKGTSIDERSMALSSAGTFPETAEVGLPPPFTGHASYSKSPASLASWTGDLSVYMPSVGRIPLTGPNFRAALCRATSIAALETCSENQQPGR